MHVEPPDDCGARMFERPPFELDHERKRSLLLPELLRLTAWHAERCPPYAALLRTLRVTATDIRRLEDLCYLPVRLFKLMELQSVSPDEVFKVLLSSGTTSQIPSRIVLDKITAQAQTRALAVILGDFLGKKRLPMVICDNPAVLRDRAAHTARGAGILGMSVFGRDHFYVLDEQMDLRLDALLTYLESHAGEAVFFFGFTFMIWQHLIEALQRRQMRLPSSNGVLIHGGGWKALSERAVDNVQFKAAARDVLGVSRVHNFYGMVEQVGSIYMECEEGHLHAPAFAEVLVRDFRDWSLLPRGKEGVLQTLSILPRSYPGHSLLTEDLAVVLGEDDCPCARKGTYFAIRGRIPSAELRGCSDTYAANAVLPS